MSENGQSNPAAAARLRETFDRTFAQAPSSDDGGFEDFLAVRVGSHPYVIRLSEITGLYCERKVVPLVGETSPFIGIATFRGTIAPVYDLGTFLGSPGAPTYRWLVLTGTPSPVGLAFNRFEGHARVARSSIHSSTGDDRGHVRGAVLAILDAAQSLGSDVLRPIVRVPSVLGAIARQVAPISSTKER